MKRCAIEWGPLREKRAACHSGAERLLNRAVAFVGTHGPEDVESRAGQDQCSEAITSTESDSSIPPAPLPQPFSAVPRMLLEPRTPWPRRVDEPPRQPPPLDGAAAAITFIGHATFLIQTQAGNLLTDPMYSAACRSAEPARATASPAAGRPLRRPAADLDRVAEPQPLRSLRSADAADDRGTVRSDRRHAAGERRARALRGYSPRRGARLVAGGDELRAADHADAGAALLRAHAVRSQPCPVGWLHARGGRTPHLLRRRHRLRGLLSATSAGGSVRSIWRCCRSVPTSHAGSCRPFT